MKRKIIANPSARGGSVGAHLGELKEFFKSRDGNFDITITKTYSEIEESARQAIRDGYEQIVAVGGDGTVGAVFNGYFENGNPLNSDVRIAVSKWGTGSDYFKAIEGDRTLDWRELVYDHDPKKVDVGLVEFQESFLPSRVFANMASIGISAEIAQRKNQSKWNVPFGLSYVMPTLKTLVSFTTPTIKVQCAGKTKSEKAFAVVVSKGTHLGGGMRLGTEVRVDDGEFEVTLIRSMGLSQALTRLPRLYRGGISNDTFFEKARVKEIFVESDPKSAVELDGETFPPSDIKVTLKPLAVTVCFPKS